MNNNNYPITIVLGIIMMMSITTNAQMFQGLDKNPHDIAYFKMNKSHVPTIKVVYGRPVAQDDQVFGTQVPYGKVWNTGSNESTEVKFYQNMMLGNKFIKAGTYVLYTIPNKNYWTIILNNKTDTYGAYFYDPKADVAKIEVAPSNGAMVKNFSIGFSNTKYGSQMVLAWAKTRVKIPLYFEESLITKI